jgi:hypothetical protein
VEENLEGSTSERLQSINTKAYLSIKDSEFEKLLFKFDYREKVSRATKNRLQNEANEFRRKAQTRAAESSDEPETGTQIGARGADRATERRAYLRGELNAMGGIEG